jgi:hypothetical protein
MMTVEPDFIFITMFLKIKSLFMQTIMVVMFMNMKVGILRSSGRKLKSLSTEQVKSFRLFLKIVVINKEVFEND